MDGLRALAHIGQWHAPAGVWQHEIMLGVAEGQLLTQAGFGLAQRVAPPTDRRPLLAIIESQALNNGGADRPPPLGQYLRARLTRTDYDAVGALNHAPAPVRRVPTWA